ncbi:GntR family transcriptional regulator [Bosea sp. 2RAB26]|uniref:GntR family transcriptional regulator n=1 Tax=Bosea sp. 2RAB26 TaxID=3237476 RepID=UPI003F8EAA80
MTDAPAPASRIVPFMQATTYQRLREAIRADIVAGTFAPSEHLKMAALVQRYGTSPAPIREALGQLEGEGWIEILPNRGARVRSIERAFIRELFEIRLALEPPLAGYSAAVATVSDINALWAIHKDYAAAIGQGNSAAISSTNGAFHTSILSIRPNRSALVLLDQHNAFVGATRRRFGFPDHRLAAMVPEHEAIIEACARNDATAVRRLMRAHIQRSIDELIPRLPGNDPDHLES